MRFLPDTNACIGLLRAGSPVLTARWRSTQSSDVLLCSIVVYELRYGAERCADPAREHRRLSEFLAPFASLPFDDHAALECARIRRQLERGGISIGPHDLQIAAIAVYHKLTLVTHNTREFSRIPGLDLVDWEG